MYFAFILTTAVDLEVFLTDFQQMLLSPSVYQPLEV